MGLSIIRVRISTSRYFKLISMNRDTHNKNEADLTHQILASILIDLMTQQHSLNAKLI